MYWVRSLFNAFHTAAGFSMLSACCTLSAERLKALSDRTSPNFFYAATCACILSCVKGEIYNIIWKKLTYCEGPEGSTCIALFCI